VDRNVIIPNMATQRITIEIDDLYLPKEAAKYLGITTMTLWRWTRDGKIVAVMLNHAYYHRAELERVAKLRKKT